MKRISSFLVTVALIVVMGGCALPSQNLEIRDWYDLDAIRNNLAGNHTLMNDLDSTTPGYEELASPTANQGKGWQPIETWGHPFKGSFDGQGYEIRDLFINRPDESGVGLFGYVGVGGVIKNVSVVNATVTGSRYVGGLVGENKGTVSNSYSSSNVNGSFGIGGLVGFNFGTVSNSYSTGSVTGKWLVGGLVGDNWGSVSNSYSTGSVTGAESKVGGLVGFNFGTVSNSYSTGSVTGAESKVGGLVGDNYHGTVSNSYATGSVTGEDGVGGLVGWNRDTVSNSYSSGNVTGNSSVGGLVGCNYDTVSNSYSSGSVSGNDDVGGLVGYSEGTVSNSFWDTETSGQATSAGGTGKTTAEMQNIDAFSGAAWNIIAVAPGSTNTTYIWNIVNGVTYPFLSGQP